MKKVTNNILKGMASRFSATVMLLAMGCIAAFAQGNNKLYIEDFDLAPGETKTLDIILENEDPVSSLQFDIYFPDGLTYVEGSLERNTSRLTRSSHSIVAAKQGDGKGYYRMGILSTSSEMTNSSVKGNNGTLLRIKVTADNDYKGSFIYMDGIIGSNGTVPTPVRLDMPSLKVKANVHVGDLSNNLSKVQIRPLTLETIDFSLDNIIDIVALQAVVTLPEGINLAEDADGEYITYSDRLSGNVVASVNLIPGETNKYQLIISSLTSDKFIGSEGTLFGLNIMANKSFKSGDIVVSDVIVSSAPGVAYELGNELSVSVTSVDDPTGDGVWNINDIYSVVNIYNSGDFNSDCDLNNDGIVNINDIYIAIGNYNKGE
ncbi:MAG: hypothetical protein MR421_12245 [Prevotella sp.]|nr:hypothetical protein [Prevotella sp.]